MTKITLQQNNYTIVFVWNASELKQKATLHLKWKRISFYFFPNFLPENWKNYSWMIEFGISTEIDLTKQE